MNFKAIRIKAPVNGMYSWAITDGQHTSPIEKDHVGNFVARGFDLSNDEIKNALRNARARISRKSKDQAMRDLGLTKVRGALGGKYYE